MTKLQKQYAKKLEGWMPVSLLNTYVDRLIRNKGKADWRAKLMYKELYYRLMCIHGEIVRPEAKIDKDRIYADTDWIQ